MEKICEICGQKDCGYINREIEERCDKIQWYQQGFDDAADKACDYFKSVLYNDDIWGVIVINKIHNVDEFIELFKKAMEE